MLIATHALRRTTDERLGTRVHPRAPSLGQYAQYLSGYPQPMIELDGPSLWIPRQRNDTAIHKGLGGKLDKKRNEWRLPAISLNVLRLIDMYGESILDGAPEDVVDLAMEPWGFKGFSDEELDLAEQHPRWQDLYPFQKETVEYLFCNPHGAGLTVISPGLGKTPISIIAASLLGMREVLVLSPLTLGKTWVREFSSWWGGEPPEIHRAMAGAREPGSEWTITNHEVIQELILRDEDGQVLQPEWITNARRVKQWIEEGPKKLDPKKGKKVWARERLVRVRRDYLKLPWQLIMVDESILIQNRRAVKGGVLSTLRKANNPFLWELSGLPTTKLRDRLFRQFQIMYPKAFTSYWRWAEFFCIVDKEGWGWTIEDDNPAVDPHHYLRDFMIVFAQEDVLPQLPKYLLEELPLDATEPQRKALDEMFNEWIVEAEDEPEAPLMADNWLARMTRLEQITSNMGALPKPSGKGFYKESSAITDALVEKIQNQDIEYPLLVWCWFVESTHIVAKRIQKADKDLKVGCVVGKDKLAHKESTIEAFREGELDVLVMQMATGKYGHTFTKTKTVYYHDLTTDTDALLQSLQRVPRIGLEHRPLLIIPWVEDSAYELIQANLDEKLPSIGEITKSRLATLLAKVQEEAEGIPGVMKDWVEDDPDE